ncbi:unnamed protein product [Gordionus sp. m RMFG-2023]
MSFIIGGYGACKYLIEDINIMNFSLLMIVVTGSYTLIGGLVGTLYVSYFNTSFIFIFLLYVCHMLYNDHSHIGGLRHIYNNLYCMKGPYKNLDNSYLTFVSLSGFQFGIINLIGNFGAVFIDQSYWNCAMASKPKNSVIGFILGGLIWFSIPFTLATAGGLTFRALEFAAGKSLLNQEDIDRGLVLPRVLTLLMGRKGAFLMYLLLLMAISSTASSNIVAVVSILTYDIFQIYIRPFRRTTDINSCLLCGMQRGRKSNIRDKCMCVSMTYCGGCKTDDRDIESSKYNAIRPIYKCRIHGHFRNYYSEMENKKTWIMLFTTLSILPLTFALNILQINLNWLYQFMGIIIGSAIIPVSLSIYWAHLTSKSMIFGASLGTLVGVSVWALISWTTLAVGRKQGNTKSFIERSGEEFPMVLGNIMSILTSGIITVSLTFLKKPKNKEEIAEIWENTRDIDNPLSPWVEVYENDFDIKDTHYLIDRPTLSEVKIKFSKIKIWATVMSFILFICIIILWPSIACTLKVFNYKHFVSWIYLSLTFSWLGATFIIIVPVVQEVITVYV